MIDSATIGVIVVGIFTLIGAIVKARLDAKHIQEKSDLTLKLQTTEKELKSLQIEITELKEKEVHLSLKPSTIKDKLALFAFIEKERPFLEKQLNSAVEETNADRGLLIIGHNGYALPNPFRPYWVSVVVADKNNQNAISLYNEFIVDENYCDIVLHAWKRGWYYVKTEKLPNGAILQRIYDSENVVKSLIFYVTIANNQMLYGSFSIKSNSKFFNVNTTRMNLLSKVSNIKARYNKRDKEYKEQFVN